MEKSNRLPPDLELESFKQKRDEIRRELAEQKKKQREAVKQGDSKEALKLNEIIRKTTVGLEDAETCLEAAQARLAKITANEPRAKEAKARADTAWQEIMKLVEELRKTPSTIKELMNRIQSAKADLDTAIGNYQHLTEEPLIEPPGLDQLFGHILILQYANTEIHSLPPWECLTERECAKQNEPKAQALKKAEEEKRQADIQFLKEHAPNCPQCEQRMMLLTDDEWAPKMFGGTELLWAFRCDHPGKGGVPRYARISIEQLKAGKTPPAEKQPFIPR